MRRTRTIVTAVVLALALPAAGCYAYDETPGGSVGAEVYTPDTYLGNTVYFDNNEPYYYRGGQVYYVPRDRPEYNAYINHYRRSPAAYNRWHASHAPAFHRPAQRREEPRNEHEEHHR
jgi:hypothetical protein